VDQSQKLAYRDQKEERGGIQKEGASARARFENRERRITKTTVEEMGYKLSPSRQHLLTGVKGGVSRRVGEGLRT